MSAAGMTAARLAELKATPRASFTNAMRLELITEVRRLHDVIAGRPTTHVLKLDPDAWHCQHPIECNALECSLIDGETAYAILRELGPGTFVHDPETGLWLWPEVHA